MKRTLLAFALAALPASPALSSVVVPYGVQTGVSVSTVTGEWGWTISYQGLFSDSAVSMATVFAGLGAADQVMIAARPVGSSTFTLLAAAPVADVLKYTAPNQTTSSNGAEWYFNEESMGFAGLGDKIYQNSADVGGLTDFGTAEYGNSHLRLSWHTTRGSDGGMVLEGGWRAGDNIWLNKEGLNKGEIAASKWERVVLVANSSTSAIPEPGGIIPLAGLIAAGCLLRRRNR